MARKNIFEILSGSSFNLKDEITRLVKLLSEEALEDNTFAYTIEDFVDEYEFSNWEHRSRCTCIDDMKSRLGIGIMHPVLCTMDQHLIFLEYIGNIIFLCNHSNVKNFKYDQFDYILESYDFILEQLNYELIELPSHRGVILCEKNLATTAAAEISDPNLALSILRYNHYALKGDFEAKKSILFSLGHDLERYSRELKTFRPDLVDDAGFLLNSLNIRHNNSAPPEGKALDNYIPHVAEMLPETLEEWYDETYQVLLLCILEYDHLARKGKIKELKDACNASRALAKKK